MSDPNDDDEPTSIEDTPAKRLSPSEMFPAEVREEPPDVFDVEVRRSHRSHKAQVEAFSRLAKDLVGLAPSALASLDLAPELHDAVAGCRDLRKSARTRELRRIATKLRQVDARDLRDRVDALNSVDRAAVQREKSYEQWRERLLEGGDAELTKFVHDHPTADRQHLRQLIRTASGDRTKGKAVAAYRSLLRAIRALDRGDGSDGSDGS